jgi:acetyl esterase
MKTRSLLIGISIIVFCASIVSTAHAGITTKTEVYAVRGKRQLKIHLHYPDGWKAEDTRPSIIFFHGGSWSGGSPKKFLKQAEYFASRGMVSARAEYRVKSRDGVTPDDCVRDARSSLRWMKKNAEKLGIDPAKIVASGGSAGGHLAACMMIENRKFRGQYT